MTSKEAAKIVAGRMDTITHTLRWPMRMLFAAVVLTFGGLVYQWGWNLALVAAATLVGALVGLGAQFVALFVVSVIATLILMHEEKS